MSDEVVEIELLVVPDCANQAAAAELIATALADSGVVATVAVTTVASQDDAERRGFTGSPTILVNGADPFARASAPAALACRLYRTPDGLRGVPGLHDLRAALERAAAV
ncbi:DF family (seleno)protein [Cellulomonas sp. ICMP 17802]|uniref:DF family (seleno)protein n=1 Tax=Cellulomonas sp. ICMP 17802 TaxID=3239199 RepID=UPI00351B02DA